MLASLNQLDEPTLLAALAEQHSEAEDRIEEREPGGVARMCASLNEALEGGRRFHKQHRDLRPLSPELHFYLRQRLGRRGPSRLRRSACDGRVRTPRSRGQRRANAQRGSPPGGEDGEPHPGGIGDTAGSSKSLASPLLQLHAGMIARSASIDGTSVIAYAEKVTPHLWATDPELLWPFWAAVELAERAWQI